MDKILIICAHPDDETLGLGGTIKKFSTNGNEINLLIFTDGQFGRDNSKKGIYQRKNQAKKAGNILGIKNIEFLDYEDQTLDSIPKVELAKKIESSINTWKPDVVFTHFWGDVNQDHRNIFEASMIATRPKPKFQVKKFICYETPSSTEWGFGLERFNPNLFVNIELTIDSKIKAFEKYENELEKFPHPRSKDAIINRSKFWGSTIGINNAEAFMELRQIVF